MSAGLNLQQNYFSTSSKTTSKTLGSSFTPAVGTQSAAAVFASSKSDTRSSEWTSSTGRDSSKRQRCTQSDSTPKRRLSTPSTESRVQAVTGSRPTINASTSSRSSETECQVVNDISGEDVSTHRTYERPRDSEELEDQAIKVGFSRFLVFLIGKEVGVAFSKSGDNRGRIE